MTKVPDPFFTIAVAPVIDPLIAPLPEPASMVSLDPPVVAYRTTTTPAAPA